MMTVIKQDINRTGRYDRVMTSSDPPVLGAGTAGGHPGDEEQAGMTSAEQIVFLLRRYRQAMRAALEAAGHRPVPPAANWLLLALAREPGTIGELARRVGIVKQAASRMTDTLVALGYCDREHLPANRREVRVSVTEDGARAATVLLSAIQAVDAEILGQLSDEERRAFRGMLAALTAAGGER